MPYRDLRQGCGVFVIEFDNSNLGMNRSFYRIPVATGYCLLGAVCSCSPCVRKPSGCRAPASASILRVLAILIMIEDMGVNCEFNKVTEVR